MRVRPFHQMLIILHDKETVEYSCVSFLSNSKYYVFMVQREGASRQLEMVGQLGGFMEQEICTEDGNELFGGRALFQILLGHRIEKMWIAVPGVSGQSANVPLDCPCVGMVLLGNVRIDPLGCKQDPFRLFNA